MSKEIFSRFTRFKFKVYHIVFVLAGLIVLFWLFFGSKKNKGLVLTKDFLDARKSLVKSQSKLIENELRKIEKKSETLKDEQVEIQKEIIKIQEIREKNNDEIENADLEYLDNFFSARGM